MLYTYIHITIGNANIIVRKPRERLCHAQNISACRNHATLYAYDANSGPYFLLCICKFYNVSWGFGDYDICTWKIIFFVDKGRDDVADTLAIKPIENHRLPEIYNMPCSIKTVFVTNSKLLLKH